MLTSQEDLTQILTSHRDPGTDLPVRLDTDDGRDEDDGVEQPVESDHDRLWGHVHDVLKQEMKVNRQNQHTIYIVLS